VVSLTGLVELPMDMQAQTDVERRVHGRAGHAHRIFMRRSRCTSIVPHYRESFRWYVPGRNAGLDSKRTMKGNIFWRRGAAAATGLRLASPDRRADCASDRAVCTMTVAADSQSGWLDQVPAAA
jgi:hypothetical protein